MATHDDSDAFVHFEESDFFNTRKDARQERRLITKRDRSKFKKTDQEQLKKNVEHSKEALSDSLIEGLVINIRSQDITVSHDNHLFTCTLRGVLKKENVQKRNLIIVGDKVLFQKIDGTSGVVVEIRERKSIISRSDPLDQKKEHLLVANVDQVFITVSCIDPPLRPAIIDRYIIAAQRGNVRPIIVCNKVDLLQDASIESFLLEKGKEIFEECRRVYRELCIQFIETSVTTLQGIEELKALMKDKISAFCGQSGTGKSSILGLILGQSLRVGKTVQRTKKGSHTTTFAQLFSIPQGGWCVDTPGIKSFGVWKLTPNQVRKFYPEFEALSSECQFPDCSHRGEKGCAIEKALEENKISPFRYESYLSLLSSVEDKHLRR